MSILEVKDFRKFRKALWNFWRSICLKEAVADGLAGQAMTKQESIVFYWIW